MANKKIAARKKSVEIQQVKYNSVSVINPEILISKAIENNVPVESLERLLAMRSDLIKEQAQREYNQAMSEFQSKCPVIEKTKPVYNKDGKTIRYCFAPLDEIKKQIGNILNDCGLSYSFDSKIENDWIAVTVTVTHINGHFETSEFPVQIDRDAYMNIAQQNASALTFAKRYAFLNAFGILTGDTDDDAATSGIAKTQADLEKKAAIIMTTVLNNIDTVQEVKNALNAVTANGPEPDYNYAAQLIDELKSEVFQILWTAPSKGGPFTTAEREMIRKDVTPIIKQIRQDKIAKRNAKKEKSKS